MWWGVLAALGSTMSAGSVWPVIQTQFDLPQAVGNPFDPEANDVRVSFIGPAQETITVPAFFDGDGGWKARLAPSSTGSWRIGSVTHNGQAVEVSTTPATWTVAGEAWPGYVRLSADGKHFERSGLPWLPMGCNVGWPSQAGDVRYHLDKLGAAGCNWSRVWMCHWGNANLDWTFDHQPALGDLSLEVARRWDGIITAAEERGMAIQVVLQHHGQYSTTTNSNWAENPWNAARGGWLTDASQFFTDERAGALTRAKYRYIVARWGYSPAVMAWELFNEVEYTAGVQDKHIDDVAAWHREMANYLRAQDVQHHLITTSSDLSLPIYDAVDYLQPHSYAADPLATVARHAALAVAADKPLFLGEVGSNGDLQADDGSWMHRVVWASLLSDMPGVAQYWAWDTVDKNNLYRHFTQPMRLLSSTDLVAWPGAHALSVSVNTDQRGPLKFGPGGGWRSDATRFVVGSDGTVSDLAKMGAYLHGDFHRDLFPQADFIVDLAKPARVTVRFGQVAKAGAKPSLLVHGHPVATLDYPEADGDHPATGVLEGQVAAGRHTVTLRNAGRDWVTLAEVTIDPLVPALAVLAKGNDQRAVLWVTNRGMGEPVAGTLTVSGLRPGRYKIRWLGPDLQEVAIGGGSQPQGLVEAGADGTMKIPTLAVETEHFGVLEPR